MMILKTGKERKISTMTRKSIMGKGNIMGSDGFAFCSQL